MTANDIIKDYHAHVYYEAETLERARRLCESAVDEFGVAMGRMHEKEVGPHPMWSCQLTFAPEQFGTFVPWLALNRGGLIVFIHPQTGDDLADHRDRAIWLGESRALKLEMFQS